VRRFSRFGKPRVIPSKRTFAASSCREFGSRPPTGCGPSSCKPMPTRRSSRSFSAAAYENLTDERISAGPQWGLAGRERLLPITSSPLQHNNLWIADPFKTRCRRDTPIPCSFRVIAHSAKPARSPKNSLEPGFENLTVGRFSSVIQNRPCTPTTCKDPPAPTPPIAVAAASAQPIAPRRPGWRGSPPPGSRAEPWWSQKRERWEGSVASRLGLPII